jgi:hypothetical protein
VVSSDKREVGYPFANRTLCSLALAVMGDGASTVLGDDERRGVLRMRLQSWHGSISTVEEFSSPLVWLEREGVKSPSREALGVWEGSGTGIGKSESLCPWFSLTLVNWLIFAPDRGLESRGEPEGMQ